MITQFEFQITHFELAPISHLHLFISLLSQINASNYFIKLFMYSHANHTCKFVNLLFHSPKSSCKITRGSFSILDWHYFSILDWHYFSILDWHYFSILDWHYFSILDWHYFSILDWHYFAIAWPRKLSSRSTVVRNIRWVLMELNGTLNSKVWQLQVVLSG